MYLCGRVQQKYSSTDYSPSDLIDPSTHKTQLQIPHDQIIDEIPQKSLNSFRDRPSTPRTKHLQSSGFRFETTISLPNPSTKFPIHARIPNPAIVALLRNVASRWNSSRKSPHSSESVRRHQEIPPGPGSEIRRAEPSRGTYASVYTIIAIINRGSIPRYQCSTFHLACQGRQSGQGSHWKGSGNHRSGQRFKAAARTRPENRSPTPDLEIGPGTREQKFLLLGRGKAGGTTGK